MAPHDTRRGAVHMPDELNRTAPDAVGRERLTTTPRGTGREEKPRRRGAKWAEGKYEDRPTRARVTSPEGNSGSGVPIAITPGVDIGFCVGFRTLARPSADGHASGLTLHFFWSPIEVSLVRATAVQFESRSKRPSLRAQLGYLLEISNAIKSSPTASGPL
jgi:hypothetical protein